MAVQSDVYDKAITFDGGMNEGSHTSLLAQNQTSKNINITLKDRVLSPRPSFVEVEFKFLVPEQSTQKPVIGSLTYEQNFQLGRKQHEGRYQTSHADYIVEVVNGIIYLLDVQKKTIRIVPIKGRGAKLLNYNYTRINGHQGGIYYVLYDFPRKPVAIFPDLTARRTTELEIPASHIGTFVHNRIFSASGIEFGASDPVSPDPEAVLAPLSFKESIVTDTNPSPGFPEQFFSINFIERLSAITAMGYLKKTDGSSPIGYGPLFASTREAIYLFPVDQPRANWAQAEFGTAYIFNYGITNQKAYINVHKDVWYRCWDGNIYSTASMFTDQNKWGITNISNEIRGSLITQNLHLLQYSFMGYLSNRIFCSLKPFIVKAKSLFGADIEDYCSAGVGVLELNNASGLQGNSEPIWAGVYDQAFTGILEVVNKAYFFGKVGSDLTRNVIYEYAPHRTLDVVGKHTRRKRSRIYTQEYSFESAVTFKKMQYLQPQFRSVLGDLTMHIYYQLTNECCWNYYGGLFYTQKKGCVRSDILDELICGTFADKSEFKGIKFRLDIEGEDYKFTKLIPYAEVVDRIMPSRIFDAPEKGSCSGLEFTEAEDSMLWS